ncbi:hypothetical protein CVT26_015375 [Gymnopilus dilepis]|uniref:Uncharacterized protein n=1 Tax=Gymnopilus dilepis TaxID=231916 RepID=A0A409WA74_9AGAR|nr:hypothetical protein CVT26_015375 [Gymnopilus dilepis]
MVGRSHLALRPTTNLVHLMAADSVKITPEGYGKPGPTTVLQTTWALSEHIKAGTSSERREIPAVLDSEPQMLVSPSAEVETGIQGYTTVALHCAPSIRDLRHVISLAMSITYQRRSAVATIKMHRYKAHQQQSMLEEETAFVAA